MNRIARMEAEYINAIESNPTNSEIYNDYAVFLYRYKKDTISALKYLNRAIKFAPDNKIYKSNIQKILKSRKAKIRRRYYIFSLIVAGIMFWIGYNGYTNFMNLFSLFVLVQIVLNYQNNLNGVYS